MKLLNCKNRALSSRGFARARRVVACASLLSGVALAVPQNARADEFSTVVANDPMHRLMNVIERSGWLSAPVSKTTNAALSTRYEMALQTAEAIYAVTARHEADASWDATVSVFAVRALRDLTTALRPELQKLGVDTNAALRVLAQLAAPAASSATSSTRTPLLTPRNSETRNETQESGGTAWARRFRIDSAVSALERASQDPLGSGVSARVRGASLTFDMSRSLSLRAGYLNRDLATIPSGLDRLGLHNAGTLNQNEERSLAGGLDFSLRKGLLFSTQIEKIAGDGNTRGGTRLTGGVGLSAWQNRLSLVAKLSRLTPEDVNSISPSTMAGVNLGLDVSRSLSVNLLYQRLFSAPTTGRSSVLAGGVSIKF